MAPRARRPTSPPEYSLPSGGALKGRCWLLRRSKVLQDEGRYASVSETAAERVERGCLGSLLRLTRLAPDIIQTIMDGPQGSALGLPALLKVLPAEWSQQREAIAQLSELNGLPVSQPSQ